MPSFQWWRIVLPWATCGMALRAVPWASAQSPPICTAMFPHGSFQSFPHSSLASLFSFSSTILEPSPPGKYRAQPCKPLLYFVQSWGPTSKLENQKWADGSLSLACREIPPCRDNGFVLSVSLTSDKAEAWAGQLRPHLATGAISSHELEKLIGKLGFSQTNLFGKFARALMRPLYRKFYDRNYTSRLSSIERSLFLWWIALIQALQPRVPRRSLAKPDFVVYTDAALLSRRIAGLVVSSTPSGPLVNLLAEGVAPKFRLSKFNKKNPIIGMEMLAPLAVTHSAPTAFEGKRVNIYIDNDAASNALIRGDCSDPVLAAMIRAFWEKAERLSLDVWIGRVGSAANPADRPARRKKLPFKVLKRVQFNSPFHLICTTLRGEARWPLPSRTFLSLIFIFLKFSSGFHPSDR